MTQKLIRIEKTTSAKPKPATLPIDQRSPSGKIHKN